MNLGQILKDMVFVVVAIAFFACVFAGAAFLLRSDWN